MNNKHMKEAIYFRIRTCKPTSVLLLVCSIILVACSEEVARDLLGYRTPIKLSVSVESQESGFTRAVKTLNTTAGFTISSTSNYNKVRVQIDGDDYSYVLRGESGTNSNIIDIAAEETQPYFPVGESSVKVFACYPGNELTTTSDNTYFTIQADQTSTDNYLRSDLMTASGTASRTQNSNGTWDVTEASLAFQHKMAKLIVNASAESGSGLTIKSVVINDVKPRVQLTTNENGYVVGNAITDSEETTYDVIALNGAGESAVIIPAQTFAPASGETQVTFATVTVDYVNPSTGAEENDVPLTYYFSGSGKTFEANKVYTMNIIVGIDNIILYDKDKTANGIDISAWSTNSNINIYPTVVHTLLDDHGKIELNITTPKVYTGQLVTLSQSEINVKARTDLNQVEYTLDLVLNSDYTLTYKNNIDAGTATVTAVGIGNYSGTTSIDFPIGQRNIAAEDVTITSIPEEPYNGQPKEPAVILTDEAINRTLYLGTDYTLTYPADITSQGTKTVVVTGKGNYTGTRNATYVIGKARGTCTFADATVRAYVPTGKTVTYTNPVTIDVGDGSVTGGSSDNTAVATVSGDVVTFKAAGTAHITLNITGNNYQYDDYTFTAEVKSGPVLPIMYVGPHNMGTASAMADSDNSTASCFWTWTESGFNGFNMYNLKQNGLTVGGIHYHMPSNAEWLSIVPTSGNLSFTTEQNKTGISDTGVKFEVTTAKSNQTSDADYTFYQSLSSTSDYYSTGTGTVYAHRFIGTNYGCAYRYDYLSNSSATNIALTGNRGGYSLLIRVIYLGNISTRTKAQLMALDWDNPEFKVTLPCSGYQGVGTPAGTGWGGSMSGGYGYYWSATTSTSGHYGLYINGSGSSSSNNWGHGSSYSVRLFRDRY